MSKVATPIQLDNYTTEDEAAGLSAEQVKRRDKKKIVRRRSGDSEQSNESRRSFKMAKAPHIAIELKVQPKTQIPLYDSVEMTPKQMPFKQENKNRQGYTYVRMNRSTTLRRATADPFKQQQQPNDAEHESCQQKITYLEEEIKMRNQEIELMEDERVKLRKEIGQFEAKFKTLQESNKTLQEQIEKQKEQIKKSSVDKKKLQIERQSLIKKITFLQKINFSTQTKNIQSYREEHLERQLLSCRQRLARQKSEVQKMLETELTRSKQELFSVKKSVQALQISNSCLQKKLDEKTYFESNNDEYTTLRTRYRKFLVEFKELRRDYERLQSEHRHLQSQLIVKTDDDLSLDLSTL